MNKMFVFFFTLLGLVPLSVNAVSLVYVFEGSADSALRTYEQCIQPCDMPVAQDPDSPSYVTNTREESNIEFRFSFVVDWQGDPEYNNWDSAFSQSRLETFNSVSQTDTITYSYSDPSKNETTATSLDTNFSIFTFYNSTFSEPNASWNQYNSSGTFQNIGSMLYGNSGSSFAFELIDKSINDPRTLFSNESVVVSDNFIYDYTELNDRNMYELSNISAATLTSYYGNSLPEPTIGEVPLPGSLILLLSGLFPAMIKLFSKYRPPRIV